METISYKDLNGTLITETIYKDNDCERRVYEGVNIRERVIYKKFNIFDIPTDERGILEEITYENKKEIIYKDDEAQLKIKTVYKTKEIIQNFNVGLMNYAAARIPSFYAKLKFAED